MADDINAQEHLEAVQSIIVTCESTANEIESQFAQFDTILEEAESRSTELITELDANSAEVITHTEEFQTEMTESIGQMTENVGEFVTTMAGMLETVESNSGELFNKLTEMDGAHEEISSQIEENASHMKEIFGTLTTSWTDVAEKITSLQEERTTEIDTSVKELSETQQSQQEEELSTTVELQIENFNTVIVDSTQEHMEEIAGHFKDSFAPELEALTEKNKELQEQGGSEFSDMRSETMDKMFGGAKELFEAVDGIMGTMKGTVNITSEVADATVDAMDLTNVGLNQLNDAIENILSLLGGLSMD